jgi:hypothetical protein
MLNENKRTIIQNKFNLKMNNPTKLNEIDFTNSKKDAKIKRNPLINPKNIINYQQDIIFGGKELLNIDEPKLDINENVYVCIYHIINKRNPILLYSLLENEEDDMIDFYKFCYVGGVASNEIIFNLKNIFSEWNKSKFTYDGYLNYKNKKMLMFKCDLNEDYRNKLMQTDGKINFVMVSEVINHGNSFNLKINNSVSDFLLNNPKFCFLYDNQDQLYEVPAVAYFGDTYSKNLLYINLGYRKNFTYKDDKYYIFLDYLSCIENLNNDIVYKNDENKGIIKYALFLGNHHIIRDINNDGINTVFDSLRINTKYTDKITSKILLSNKKDFYPISYLQLK